jgi:hypothetical protein
MKVTIDATSPYVSVQVILEEDITGSLNKAKENMSSIFDLIRSKFEALTKKSEVR